MKVKVIKRAQRETPGEEEQRPPQKRRLANAVEKWVADIRAKSDAESRMSFEHLFRQVPKTSI
jgi:hypothetical protein